MRTRDFYSDDGLIPVPKFVLEDIKKNGFGYVTLPCGCCYIKITEHDLYYKKQDFDDYIRTIKK
jgi:hypothetical protein